MAAMQQRSLPHTLSTQPVEEEAESNYVTFHRPSTAPLPTSSPSTSLTSSLTTTRPVQCDSSSVHSEELKSGDYVVFQPSPSCQHARSKSTTSVSKFSDQGSSTDDDDVIYAEPYTEILRPLKQLGKWCQIILRSIFGQSSSLFKKLQLE